MNTTIRVSDQDPHLFELLDPDPDPHRNADQDPESRREKMTTKNRKNTHFSSFQVIHVLFLSSLNQCGSQTLTTITLLDCGTQGVAGRGWGDGDLG